MKIAAAQTPEFREDLDAALAWATDRIHDADAGGAVLLCLPEAFLQGYLTERDSARRHALDLSSNAFAEVLERLPKSGPMIVMGLIERDGDRLFNTAVVIHEGAFIGRYRKTHLLSGEKVFMVGDAIPTFEIKGLTFGINICFDTNFPETARAVADRGARLIVCPSNNMMRRHLAEAWRDRHNLVRGERCRETGLWLISADVTGERDGRIAWGPTGVLNPAGEVVAQLPLDEPGLLVFDLPA